MIGRKVTIVNPLPRLLMAAGYKAREMGEYDTIKTMNPGVVKASYYARIALSISLIGFVAPFVTFIGFSLFSKNSGLAAALFLFYTLLLWAVISPALGIIAFIYSRKAWRLAIEQGASTKIVFISTIIACFDIFPLILIPLALRGIWKL